MPMDNTFDHDNGKLYVNNALSTIIKAGEVVSTGDVRKFCLSKTFAKDRVNRCSFSLVANIYTTTSSDPPKFVDSSCRCLGTIVISDLANTPDMAPSDDYNFTCVCKFDTSCLAFDVHDDQTGKKKGALFEFQTQWSSRRVVLSD